MEEPLRLLIVEDSLDDADLIVLRLKQDGFKCDWQRVETETEYQSALDESWDIIIADYSLPQFSGLRALECIKERGLDIPFILMSGTMGEEIAVNAIKLGASDYLLKDRPARLGSAIRNLLAERRLRAGKMIAEQVSRRMEERLKVLHQVSQEIARVSLDLEQVYSAIHHAVQKLMPAEAFVISLIEESTQENVAVYLVDKAGRWPEERAPIGEGLTGYVCQTGKSVLINDVSKGTHIDLIHFGNDEHVNSIIAVPLFLGEKIIGMLSAQSLQSDAYTGDDLFLLEMLSAHAAVAIQNARYHSAIRESEEKYRLITDNISDTVFLMNMDLKVLYMSPSLAKAHGYTKDEINAMPLRQLMTPESYSRLRQIFGEDITEENLSRTIPQLSHPIEIEYIRKDGTTFWSENKLEIVKDAQGKPEGIIGLGRDISERKESQKALIESEAKYRSLFENVLDGVCRTTPDGGVLAVNPALAKMLGYESVDELLNTNTVKDWWADPVERQIWKNELEKLGEVTNYELVFKTKKNKKLVLLNNARVHRNEQGEILYYQGTLTDITDRIQHQRELEALTVVGEALRFANTPSEILPVILDQIMGLVQAYGVALATLDEYTDEISINLKVRNVEGIQIIPLQGEKEITRKVFQTGVTYTCDDITKDHDVYLGDVFPELMAGVCIPLSASGRVINTLWVFREYQLETDEIRILEAIADITANALQRAYLFEKTTLQLRQLTSLQAIDHAITGSIDLNVTLNILLDQVISQLNVHTASVLLFNPISQTLEYSASKGFSVDNLKKYRARRGGGLASQAATRMEVVSCELGECTDYPFLAEAGYITHMAVPLIAKGQVKGVLELFHRERLVTTPEWRNFFETLASTAAISIDNATLFSELQRANIELSMSYDATIEGWSRALDLRDQETEGHTQRVVQITLELANDLGITGKELMHVRRGALLHDIGKMAIPDSILLKPGPLTDEEWVIMRQHPVYAYQLLHPIPYLRQALDIPHCHHEKWDGTGYPRRLKGTQIPLSARIFAIVDVFDAITSDRPYRNAMSVDEAVDYIRKNTGTHFEPKVVDAFFKWLSSNGRY